MSIQLPQGFHWDNELKLGSETSALTALVWPNYLVLDSDIPDPDLKIEITAQEFARRFPVWGIRRNDSRQLVAYLSAVQLSLDLNQEKLPDTGWRFAIQSAGGKDQPNCLCLLVANIDPGARGFGFSKILIARAKQAARELSFDSMIAPVRPTLKHTFPFLPIADYMAKRTASGEAYDPWIGVHLKSGGQMAGICQESVEVKASLGKWREWTGLSLLDSGDQLLPGGLVPLKIDTLKNVGIYREPGVWLRYHLPAE